MDSMFGSYFQDSLGALKRIPDDLKRYLGHSPDKMARGILGPAHDTVMMGARMVGPQADVADYVDFTQDAVTAAKQGRYGDAVTNSLFGAAAIPFMFLPGGVTAWHGGPTPWKPEPDFPQGRMNLKYMGEGEGRQAYGWGGYMGEAKGTGKSYQEGLGAGRGAGPEDTAKRILDAADGDRARAVEIAESRLATAAKLPPENRAAGGNLEAALNILKGEGHVGGVLYKLDLPDADAAKFLDWDAPLSEQPLMAKKIREMLDGPDNPYTGPTTKMLRESLQDFELGSTTGETLIRIMGGDQAASEALRKAGIPGLKYYDQMSRTPKNRGYIVTGGPMRMSFDTMKEAKAFIKKHPNIKQTITSDRTRNFVVWDQDVLNRTKILDRQ